MASDAGPLVGFEGLGVLDAGPPAGTTVLAPQTSFTGSGFLDAIISPDIEDDKWTVRVTDKDHDLVALLPTATWGSISRTLNEPRSLSGLTIPATDPAAALFTDGTIREVQVYRGAQLMFAGPVSRPQYRSGSITMSAADPLSYLDRRLVGDEETNELAGDTWKDQSWYASGGWVIHKKSLVVGGGVWFNYSEVRSVTSPLLPESDASLRLYNSQANPKVFLEFFQRLDITAGDFPLQVAFVAYVYLAAAPAYTAEQGHGMALGVVDPAFVATNPFVLLGYQSDGSEWEQTSTEAIDPGVFPREQWVRLQCDVTIPAGETRSLIAEFSCPDGETVYVGKFPRVVTSKGLEYKGVDIARVIDGLVDHAQDTGFGKSDLNLTISTGTAPNTGVDIDRNYPYAEHRNIWSAIGEFTAETVDVSCEVTAEGTRSVYVHYPHKGAYRPKARFEVRSDGGNCELLSWVFDTERATNRPFLFGAGSGIGRDIGYAKDTSAQGGLTLESVEYSNPLVTLGDPILDSRAAEVLTIRTEPQIVTVRTFAGDTSDQHLFGANEGDWVPLRVWLPDENGDAVFDVAADYRIVAKTIDPSDVCTFTLNRRDVPDALL